MSVIRFKQRDKNRFRKIYPYLRRKPVNEIVADGNAQIEVAILDYSSTDTVTYDFLNSYVTVPTVTATPVESDDPEASPGNVNVYIDAVTLTNVTVRVSSDEYTGKVHIQVISGS